MKKILFLLAVTLISCSKIEQPKGTLDTTREIYITATKEVAEKAYEVAYLNPKYTNAICKIRVSKKGDKLVIPAQGLYYDKYHLEFAEGRDYVVRVKDPVYPIYDTIAYIPQHNMQMFFTKCNLYIEKSDFINLYNVFEKELVAIPR